ncbi:hypothetical protein HK097_007912 [Rhizophlyctis rosea]|uniref:F-box domain-containing protein n=1 Tax=Rhizophlyctis rosea TaxID=64517 RepID=A0AAD5X4W7_9FUNG|nr:hypothetical protein HK097_007912 [Rhizophlyctis rosea]
MITGNTTPTAEQRLPPEVRLSQNADILHEIFAYYEHPFHLINVSKVSRLWRRTANHNIAWKHIAETMKPLEADFFWNDNYDFENGNHGIITAQDARIFCIKFFSDSCGVCLKGHRHWSRTSYCQKSRTYIKPCNCHQDFHRDYEIGYYSDDDDWDVSKPPKREDQPCVHECHGYLVRKCCMNCHAAVFRKRIITDIESLMKHYGFENEG